MNDNKSAPASMKFYVIGLIHDVEAMYNFNKQIVYPKEKEVADRDRDAKYMYELRAIAHHRHKAQSPGLCFPDDCLRGHQSQPLPTAEAAPGE